MTLILRITFFVLGLIIGSFLNVVILRLNTGRTLRGRSACMSCQSTLQWYELIPFFSFVVLHGRCRTCKTKISIQYPLVELASGLIFGTLFLKFSAMSGQDIYLIFSPVFALTFAYYALVFSILLVITAYDLKHKIIPDMLVYVFGALSFVGLFFFPNAHIPSTLEFFSGIFIALPFAALWLVSSGRWIGLGDAKLALGIGWLLRFSGALSALGLAFFSGAIVGIGLIFFTKRYGMKSEIPFALYLFFGTLLVFMFNLRIFPI